MSPTERKPSQPQIQNLPGTPAYELEMAEVRLNPLASEMAVAKTRLDQYLASPEHQAQVTRVKALSTELKKILAELADKFDTTPEEMAKLIARRMERKSKERP